MLNPVRDWIILALEDFSVVEALDPDVHRGAIVYHLQQFVEKLCKAIICMYSQEPPKTHRPSDVIDQIVAEAEVGRLKMSREERELLLRISSLAKTFEDEATRPRYGVRHHDRIIPPNEYYSTEQVKYFISDARHIAGLIVRLARVKGLSKELKDVLTRLEEIAHGK